VFFVDEYDPEALDAIIKQQFSLADRMKNNGKIVYQIGIIVDDFADDPSFTRSIKCSTSFTFEAVTQWALSSLASRRWSQ